MAELRVNASSLENADLEVEDVKIASELTGDEDGLLEVELGDLAIDEVKKVRSKPNYRKYSNSIEIINTLGYSDSGTFTDITQYVLANAAVSNPNVKVFPHSASTKGRGSNKGKTSWVKVDKKNGNILSGELYRRTDNSKFIVPVQYSPDGTAYEIVRRKGTTTASKNNSSKYRKCQTVARIFGYIIKNVGDEPILMFTEKWYYDEDEGQYVSTGRIDKMLQPGETMQISKAYLIMNAGREEFDAKFKNGIIAWANKKAGGTTEERLQRYFFKFTKESGLDVHGEDVKLQIADKITHEDGTVEWVVIKKYIETFGEKMNNRVFKKTKEKIAGKGENSNDSASRVGQDIREMYNNEGIQL